MSSETLNTALMSGQSVKVLEQPLALVGSAGI